MAVPVRGFAKDADNPDAPKARTDSRKDPAELKEVDAGRGCVRRLLYRPGSHVPSGPARHTGGMGAAQVYRLCGSDGTLSCGLSLPAILLKGKHGV